MKHHMLWYKIVIHRFILVHRIYSFVINSNESEFLFISQKVWREILVNACDIFSFAWYRFRERERDALAKRHICT